ncbi:MAG: GNAT family N-acetyltransferase [Cohaesibacter sp.]|nr:GNAT family N-acetyltransferase [Cohaesibacter sp.]
MSPFHSGYSPFLHPAFVQYGKDLPVPYGRQQALRYEKVETSQIQTIGLVFQTVRPFFLFGGRMAQVWAHDYAPLGGLCSELGRDEASWSYEAFALLLDQIAASSEAGFLHWPFFPDQAPFSHWIERWVLERGLGALGRLRSHERAMCVIERDAAGALLRPDGGAYGLSLRTKKRKDYARQLRRLEELGHIQFCHASGGKGEVAAFDQSLEAFLALEAKGWKGVRGTALICNARTAGFARGCLPQMAADGRAQIDDVRLDGEVIASLISLRAGRGLFTWKIAFDPAYAKYSAGGQIMLHVTRKALQDLSLDFLDSLASADHSMINPLWAGRRPLCDLLVPLAPSARFSLPLAKSYFEGRDRIRQRVKELVRG